MANQDSLTDNAKRFKKYVTTKRDSWTQTKLFTAAGDKTDRYVNADSPKTHYAIQAVCQGAVAGLTNGITFGVQSKGTSFTLATVKTNEDFYNLFTQNLYYYSYSPGALQANVETVAGSWRLQNRIALDGNFGDKVEIRVRDNLSTLVGMRCSASLWRTNP